MRSDEVTKSTALMNTPIPEPVSPTQKCPRTPDIRWSPSATSTPKIVENPDSVISPSPLIFPIVPDIRTTPVQKEKSRKESFKGIENTLKNLQKENAEMRAENAARHNVLFNALQTLIASNGKDVVSTLSSQIVERSDFEEPSWPLFTTKLVFELNDKLRLSSYRDQLVIINFNVVFVVQNVSLTVSIILTVCTSGWLEVRDER